jgi:hypothetical protein
MVCGHPVCPYNCEPYTWVRWLAPRLAAIVVPTLTANVDSQTLAYMDYYTTIVGCA